MKYCLAFCCPDKGYNNFRDDLNGQLCDPEIPGNPNRKDFPRLERIDADCTGENPKVTLDCANYCNYEPNDENLVPSVLCDKDDC